MDRKLAYFVLLGYLALGRAFAYVGVSPLKLFIGELFLGGFLLVQARRVIGEWMAALVQPSRQSALMWALSVVVAYGVFTMLRGVGLGYPLVTALQCMALNYYPLYLLYGIWVGQRHPDFLAKFLRVFARVNAVYGIAFLLVLDRITVPNPLSPGHNLLGGPNASAVALLGLLAFEPKPSRAWPLLVLNGFVMLGVQVRAEWLAFLAGLLVWGRATRALGRMGLGVAAALVLFGTMYVSEMDLPAPQGRGGRISVQSIVGRAIAPIDKETAQELTEHARTYAGTVAWRTRWWSRIWTTVNQEPGRALVGYGYGFPLTGLVPYLGERAADLRTPHSVFFYTLGYGGWLGVATYFGLQLLLARLAWVTFRTTGQAFGLAMWVYALVQAHFSNFYEAPFNAISSYILIGLAIAPALASRGYAYANFARTQLLPAAGR